MLGCVWSGLPLYGNSLHGECHGVRGGLGSTGVWSSVTGCEARACVCSCTDCVPGSWLSEKPPGACVRCRCCTCQTKALLLSIQSERPRWCFPPSANKGPGHPAWLCPPSLPNFLPSPHNSPHPTAVPAEKTLVFSLFISTLFLTPSTQLSCSWPSKFISLSNSFLPYSYSQLY